MMKAWFPETPESDSEEKQLPHGVQVKGTPSTIFTDEDDEHETSSIGLSRQSSAGSYSSEGTEDSFSPNMIYQTFKAEFTGDYSHFQKKPTPSPKGYNDASPYSPFSARESSGYNSSFPRDDASPTINLTSPQLDSPSERMRRLVYNASRSRGEPAPRQHHQHDLSYSQSPSMSSSHAIPQRWQTQSTPIVSPSDSSGRKSFKSFATYRSAQLNASHRQGYAASPNSRTPIKPLKQASPGAPGVVEVRPVLCQQVPTMLPSREVSLSIDSVYLQDKTVQREDVPFDEIDFFDWNSVKVQHAARTSPVASKPSTNGFQAASTEELPPPPMEQPQSLSPGVKLLDRSQYESMEEEGLSTSQADTSVHHATMESSFGASSHGSIHEEKSFSVPELSLSTTYFEPSTDDGIQVEDDSPSPEYRRVRATLSRSHSWRERSGDSLPRVMLNRNKARTLPNNGTKRVPMDTVDVLAPKVLSYEEEESTSIPSQETTSSTLPSVDQSVSTSQPNHSFLSASKPTLTLEEIEVALSQSIASADPPSMDPPSKRFALNRSKSWKEPREKPTSSLRSVLKRSESFTLGSNQNESKSSAPMDHSTSGLRTPKKSNADGAKAKSQVRSAARNKASGPSASIHARNDIFPFSTSYYEAQASEGGEPEATDEPSSCLKAPNLFGLTRSLTWGEKSEPNTKPSSHTGIKRSVSFSSQSRTGLPPRPLEGVRKFPEQPRSNPSSEDIEVALRTPTQPTKRGGKRKNTSQALSQQPVHDPSQDNVLDFVPTQSSSRSERRSLGKTIGMTINRVGNRMVCRSTPSKRTDTFNPFDTCHWEEVGPYRPVEKEPSVPTSTSPANGQRGDTEVTPPTSVSSPAREQSDVQLSQDSGTIWTMDVMLDDLLEKVGLGSLAISPPAPTAESQENEESTSIMDTVASFQIS